MNPDDFIIIKIISIIFRSNKLFVVLDQASLVV